MRAALYSLRVGQVQCECRGPIPLGPSQYPSAWRPSPNPSPNPRGRLRRPNLVSADLLPQGLSIVALRVTPFDADIGSLYASAYIARP